MSLYIAIGFCAFLFIAMAFAMDGTAYVKFIILPIVVPLLLVWLFTLFPNSPSRPSTSGDQGLVNPCISGATYDNFDKYGGQWRNPDGKFCEK